MKTRINKKEVIEKIEINKKKIKDLSVIKIGIFGSVLKGKNKRGSDVDLLVKFKEETFDNYAELIILLEKILKRKIDLVEEANLRPELNYVKKEVEYARI
jgi:predicted nucleotidyltransferase